MTISINLLPWREELKVEHQREFFTLLGLAVGFAVGLMLCIHMLVAKQITNQNNDNDYLKHQISLLDQQISEIQELEKEKRQLLARMDIIQQLQKSRPQIVRLFDGLVRIVPDGLYLTSVSRTGNKVLLDGKAESNTRVSTFMRNIESSGWLKSPLLSLIQTDEQKDKEAKDSERVSAIDRMIWFNLVANEVMDDGAKLPTNVDLNKPIFAPAGPNQAPAVPTSTSTTPVATPATAPTTAPAPATAEPAPTTPAPAPAGQPNSTDSKK